MNKTYCSKCGKEIGYKGFCCPIMCDDCNRKWLNCMISNEDKGE